MTEKLITLVLMNIFGKKSGLLILVVINNYVLLSYKIYSPSKFNINFYSNVFK